MKNEHIDLAPVIKKLRKTAGLSQIEVAKLLGRDQATVSRLEKGTQSLSIESVFKLTNFFDISYEDLLCGKINYWRISEKFNTPLTINSKYQNSKDSFVKELLPLFKLIIKRNGIKKLERILEDLGIEDIVHMPENEKISVYIYPDFLSLVLEQKLISTKDIPEIVKLTHSLEYHGNFYEVYSQQDNGIDVIKAYCMNSSQYEGAFKNTILEFSEKTISVGFSTKDNVKSIDFAKAKVGKFIIQLKRAFLADLPSHFNFPPMIAKVAQNKSQSLKSEVVFKMIAS